MKTELINRIERIISNQNADESEIIFHLKNLLQESEYNVKKELVSRNFSAYFKESLELLNKNIEYHKMIKSGFESFDKEFGGFLPSELVVIGARPGMGKTQLLVNMLFSISKEHPVLYFTFNLSGHLLANRFISLLSNISGYRILINELSEEEKLQLSRIHSNLANSNIYINDNYTNSISDISEHCRKMVKEKNIKVIAIDYLQMLGTNKYRYNRDMELSFLVKEFKSMANELNICVLLVSQLSRDVERRGGTKIPMLSDLRDSGSIEQYADKVLFIFRPEYYRILEDEEGKSTMGITEIVVAKNVNGRLGTFKLIHDPNFTSFKDYQEESQGFVFSKERLDEIDEPF